LGQYGQEEDFKDFIVDVSNDDESAAPKTSTEETSPNCEEGSTDSIAIVPDLEERDLDLDMDEEFEECTHFLQLNPTSYFMSFENNPLYDNNDHKDERDIIVVMHGGSENITLLGGKEYQFDNSSVPVLVDKNYNAGSGFYEEDEVCSITPIV